MAPIDVGSFCASTESGHIGDSVRVSPSLAASSPTGDPHFNPPRKDARGATLRINASRRTARGRGRGQ